MSLLGGVKDLLFPPRCQGCGQQLPLQRTLHLCGDCTPLLSPIFSPLCSCCGTPFQAGRDHLCGRCLVQEFSFDAARSLFLYEEPVSSLLVRFKFSGDLCALETLTALARQSGVHDLLSPPDLILPVPLHTRRLRSRGFNQSLLLARACFPDWQDRIKTDLLLRHQETIPQTHLSGIARRNNLTKAFSLSRPAYAVGKKILLVDDVFTTGATVHECSMILAASGAARVEVFTFARAL